MCPDGNEPNDTEATARSLGNVDDCDGDGGVVMGQLEGSDDVDWFVYNGNDTFGCIVDPSRNVVSDASVRLCKFIDCDSGTADLGSCPAGGTPATSPAGHPGCCKSGTNITNFGFPDLNCAGTSDDARVLTRIDSGPAGVCTSYSVDYHY